MPKWLAWFSLYILLPAEIALCIYVVAGVLYAFTFGGGISD
jgi:hypothetical protein